MSWLHKYNTCNSYNLLESKINNIPCKELLHANQPSKLPPQAHTFSYPFLLLGLVYLCNDGLLVFKLNLLFFPLHSFGAQKDEEEDQLLFFFSSSLSSWLVLQMTLLVWPLSWIWFLLLLQLDSTTSRPKFPFLRVDSQIGPAVHSLLAQTFHCV